MSVLISVPLKERGGSIVIEAPEELAPAGVVRAAAVSPGEVVKEAGQTLEDHLTRLSSLWRAP